MASQQRSSLQPTALQQATLDAALGLTQRLRTEKRQPTADERTLLDEGVAIADDINLHRKVARIGGSLGGETFGGPRLAETILGAGWSRRGQSSITIDHGSWLSDFGATGSVDGGITGAEVPRRFPSAPLGVDSRYLYVHFPLTNLANDETGVGSFRQKSRSLASPSDMIRDIDDTSTKPESSTIAEVVQEPLRQIATVSTEVPNVLLSGQDFIGWTNADLLAAYRGAIDYHIVSEVDGAGIAAASGGDNIYEAVLYAQEQVRSAGYAPDMLALSPADALSLQLLMLTGGDHYAFATPAPQFVVSPSIRDGFGFVCDTSSLGRLFLSPFRFEVFEENAGSTNSSTVRAESNGLFVVQRPDAAGYIAAGS
jgi:hypothetical protein